jgi:tryptophan synthase alpha chain
MNRIDKLFTEKPQHVLNVYCTAGFPRLDSTGEVILALQDNGADIVEIGMPYSDPSADGPVIQNSSSVALHNGMTIATLFEQLTAIKEKIHLPVILMGYMNPIMQYGLEKFCRDAEVAGVDGIILPDLPMYEFESEYRQIFERYNLRFIFLVTPETSEERIRKIDGLCSGFLYAVSSSSTTGNNKAISDQEPYFKKLRDLKLKNPILVGFGIKDRETFSAASQFTNGAIVGSAYIKALEGSGDIQSVTKDFIKKIRG